MIQDFLADCRDLLSPGRVVTGEGLARASRNVADIARRVPALVRPQTQEEVRALVLLAVKHKTPLSPISRGHNWGLGSKLPCADGTVILDLSDLDRILEYSAEYGCLVIEPGVTQARAGEFLRHRGAPYYLDATGSGAQTSVCGNALERGVAYNTLRCEHVRPLKAISGTGEILYFGRNQGERPGPDHEPERPEILRHACGPDAAALLPQSNFAVVLEAAVHLQPKPQAFASFTIAVREEGDLPDCVQILRERIRQGDVGGVPHIFDRERLYSGLAPLLTREMRARGRSPSREEAQAALARLCPGSWWMVGSLQGSREAVRARASAIRRAFKGAASVSFMGPRKERVLSGILGLFKNGAAAMVFRATRLLRELPLGVAGDDSLFSVAWPFAQNMDFAAPPDPDESPTGYRFVAPGVPLGASSVRAFLALLSRFRDEPDLRLAASVNPMNHALGEGVVSFAYPRTPEGLSRAGRAERAFIGELTARGFPLLRLGIHQMDAQSPMNPALLLRLKQAFDPAGIIAPGRYLGR